MEPHLAEGLALFRCDAYVVVEGLVWDVVNGVYVLFASVCFVVSWVQVS